MTACTQSNLNMSFWATMAVKARKYDASVCRRGTSPHGERQVMTFFSQNGPQERRLRLPARQLGWLLSGRPLHYNTLGWMGRVVRDGGYYLGSTPWGYHTQVHPR